MHRQRFGVEGETAEFPAIGEADVVGEGAGKGFNVNVRMRMMMNMNMNMNMSMIVVMMVMIVVMELLHPVLASGLKS
jgi:hypothetical protein